MAVDFDSSGRTCWHHLASDACTATPSYLYSSTHYRMKACDEVFAHRQSLRVSTGRCLNRKHNTIQSHLFQLPYMSVSL